MKYLKNIVSIVVLAGLVAFPAQAQNKEVAKETITKTYELESEDGTLASYALTVETKATEAVKLEKSDRNMTNQDRVDTPMKVTKVISIDSDMDNDVDRVIEVSYMLQDDADFGVYPLKRGFVIKVVGKELDYNLIKNEYSVKNGEEEFFDVTTWDETK